MPKNVVCKKCNNLVNDWCEKVIDSPDQDKQGRDDKHSYQAAITKAPQSWCYVENMEG